MDVPFPDFGCKIVMDSVFGKSHCEVCGREWEAMTPQGSANHYARELGSRLAAAVKDRDALQGKLKVATDALNRIAVLYDWKDAREALAQIGLPEKEVGCS